MKSSKLIIAAAVIAAAASCGYAALAYEGAVPIGEGIISKAAPVFEAKTGVKFSSISTKLGTNKGLQALIDGAKYDIVGVGRNVTDEEKKTGIYMQLVGYDAMAVFVNKDNAVSGLTAAQLKGIMTGKTKNWKEVGGADMAISIATPKKSMNRATMSEMRKVIMGGEAYTSTVEMDKPEEFIAYVSANKGAITFDSFSYQAKGVKTISVDGVALDETTVRSRKYPLGRPLYLVTKGAPQGETKKFFEFIMSPEGQTIVAKEFIPLFTRGK